MTIDKTILKKAANEARGLAMDAVAKCKSGHLGLPLGAAEIGSALFSHLLEFNPSDPKWINRDRFVLSAGHGSMFLYSWLHLSGFPVSIEDIEAFRVLNSHTPGHPEYGDTPGVECTTGPLGQGIGNSVGMALASKRAEAMFNTDKHKVFNNHIVTLCGDGCLQEGVANEAIALAGLWGLDNWILIYDSNDVTLDAVAHKTQSGDVVKRFESYGFETHVVDGHDIDAFTRAFQKAKSNKDNRPKIIICKTIIGKGIPEVERTHNAHGEAGVPYVETARKNLGLPEERFFVSDEIKTFFKQRKEERVAAYNEWKVLFEDWQRENPELAKLLKNGVAHKASIDLMKDIPAFAEDKKIATREAGGVALNALAKKDPLIISGSADLHGSTKNYIKEGGEFNKDNHNAQNVLFGIREHAMGAIVNGIGYYGLFRASGATFLVFSDYMRPSIRLAALAKLPIFHIFTHDSVAVGEDGPTHEPVETVSSLRLIPGLDVIRPADPEETAGAFAAAYTHTEGPTALILTRQAVPMLNEASVQDRREGVQKGGYIIRKEKGELGLIIMATGSELQLALKAADEIGDQVRVVSMPCFERFERQTSEYKASILSKSCRNRIAIEAGTTGLWYKYVGLDGRVVGIDRFGLSAPGAIVLNELGINTDSIMKAYQEISSQETVKA
ncbi:MAG: transketolase [Verrucomicrobia bacterium CG22_combo_CG10-13_8_21_14_all_43_17]|nr:MAG: transketolase [Verrucomicrobia bacterium CG1_02_43_26]PIP59356.1 MAG: transketolase [Verrucomicrobia bacterium CG22_combo_CG10-13_8_21_14_all_43_17]